MCLIIRHLRLCVKNQKNIEKNQKIFCRLKNFTYLCGFQTNIKKKMKSYTPTKIAKLSNNITPFAGISLVNDEFNRCGLSQLIDIELGARGNGAKYSYSDIFRTFSNIFHSGGDCAEDAQKHLRDTLEQIPNNPTPFPDTLLRGIKELAVDNTDVISNSGKTYQFNINEKMNVLNIKSLLLTEKLKAGKYYDFDYDNQIIAHSKYDATTTYKKNKGYFPGIGSIGNMPVFVENRDGNANVKTDQAGTLKRGFKILKDNNIFINRGRFDAGSYSKDIIDVVSKNCRLFYIRANKCFSLTERIGQINDWETVEINFIEHQVASLKFTQFFEDRNYRLVVQREKNDNPQLDLFDGAFIYRCILTNDWNSADKEVVEYYNQRGSSEQIFDVMNNDFGWKHLPCSDMNYNTVYMILTAMIKNFYAYIVEKVSKFFNDILPTSRLKRFIFRFISVAGKWIYRVLRTQYKYRGRQWILNLYTDRPYEKVFV